MLCLFSSVFYWILTIRLFLLAKNSNVINHLLDVQFLLNLISSCVFVFFLFDLGAAHILDLERDSETIRIKCENFFFSWLILYTLTTFPSIAILFCRFIYVRYAQGLLIDMGRLLHNLVRLSMAFFITYWILVWIIKPAVVEDEYSSTIKGTFPIRNIISRICQSNQRWSYFLCVVLPLLLSHTSYTLLNQKSCLPNL